MDGRIFAGKYRTERELGTGPAGRTWLATGPGGEQVVVKVVHPRDAETASRIEHDVDLVSGIRHPVLPTILEWGHDGGDFFVVREHVPGIDLKVELEQQGRFAPLTAERYAAAASDALGQIHARGVIHGNVKTANLIRTPEDAIKLVGSSLGPVGKAVFGPDDPPSAAHYIAPEQVEDDGVSPATDVYSMGVVLYELVTGRVPFDGPTAASVADQHAHAVPAPIAEAAPEVPAALDAVIMRALEKAPETRYADGAALRAALEAAIRPRLAAPEPEPARKGAAWAWVVGGVVLLAVVLAWALGAFGARQVLVPSVVGMTQAEASASVGAAGLRLGSVSFAGQTVAGVANGAVSSQSPAGGAKVDPATKVDLVLAGMETVTVPDVVGATQAQATASLRTAGLAVGAITNVPTSSATPGTVLSQDPHSGGTSPKGATVDLQLAQPLATPAVPDVTGLSRADATSTLRGAGFLVRVTHRSSGTVASGNVIDQNPTGGVTAQSGSTVTIVVSSGPALVAVPGLIGKTQADAVNALTAAGFKSQITLHTGGGPIGSVIDQSPASGTKAASGSTVVITVAQ